jgi:hypothetical protein
VQPGKCFIVNGIRNLQLDFNHKFLSSEKFETTILVLNICWIEDALKHLDDRESKTQYDVTAPNATWQLSYLSPLSLNLFHVFNLEPDMR